MSIASASHLDPQTLKRLIGSPIGRVIPELVRILPGVSRVSFVAYQPAPTLDSRLSRDSDPTVDIRETAERLRKEFGIPFWDAILAIAMKRGEIPDRYVDLAILHDKSSGEYQINVSKEQLSGETVESVARELKDGFVLAFSSKVELSSGASAHIPMMDFRCTPSLTNRAIVKRAVKAMGEMAGFLVDSGRSYHFYGTRLLSHDAWLRFLAMGMLFSPIVDVRYVAHRLADGACRLRVGTGRDKPSFPTVSEIFG